MITPRRIVITVLLAVAFGGFFYAFNQPTNNQQPAIKDVAVKRVMPAPGDRVLHQSEVAVDLDTAYTGVLVSIGPRSAPVPIPEDQQVHTLVGLNRVSFTPGPGKELTRLPEGHICAVVEFWETTQSRDHSRTYTWCFESH